MLAPAAPAVPAAPAAPIAPAPIPAPTPVAIRANPATTNKVIIKLLFFAILSANTWL